MRRDRVSPKVEQTPNRFIFIYNFVYIVYIVYIYICLRDRIIRSIDRPGYPTNCTNCLF